MITEPNSFESGAWISDLRNHADAKTSIVHYKRITNIIKQIIYLFATAFFFLGLFLPWKRSRTIADKAVRTVLTTHLLTYSTEVASHIGTTMIKLRTISVFLENLNDDPKLVRCSDTLMTQLVKFVTSISLNVVPTPFRFFATQLLPLKERRFCQFEFDPSNPENFQLYYIFELDNDTIQLRTFNNSFNFDNWDPFHQGSLESADASQFFNFSTVTLFKDLTGWSYFYCRFGNQNYLRTPQMSVFSSSKNSNDELISLSGISLFTKEIANMIEKVPCEVMNSSSFSSDTTKPDENQNAFVKYALLIADSNTVIVEKDIGVVEPLEIIDFLPTFPKLDQLNSPFWAELSKVVFQHKVNEVFEFNFDKVLYLVVKTNVSSKLRESNNKKESISNGIINRFINATIKGNESHVFIACFPVDPSVQSVYYPMSVLFVLGISILGFTFLVSTFLIKRENLWRIRKIALQTPKFTQSMNDEHSKIHHGSNNDNMDDDNNSTSHYGYIPNSVMNIRDFQLEYPDDATLNKALDVAVENLTLRDDQKYVVTKKETCDFCKYFVPEKVDFQKDQFLIPNKKSGKLSRRFSSVSYRKSNMAATESEDLSENDDSDNDADFNSNINLNANIEKETDESLYKIWKNMSLPFIQVMSKKKKDDEDILNSTYHMRKGKGNKNKFIWEKFQIDNFLLEPSRMLIRYMMTLLSDCQLFFPPFDPMCVANLLIVLEKGIRNPIHAAHELFSVNQIIYGPFNYWLTNKLDILVLFFAVYFSHFDYRLYIISNNQQKDQNNGFEEGNQVNNMSDEDSNSKSGSIPVLNENDIKLTIEGFKAFDDDFSKIEENLKEIKTLLFQIFPIRKFTTKIEAENIPKRNESSFMDSINSSNSDIPDSQSMPNLNQNSNTNNNFPDTNGKEKTQQKKLSSTPPSFQNFKKFSINKRSYSNIGSKDALPNTLIGATTESETENTESQTTDTMTSLSFSINAIDSELNSDSMNSRSSYLKRKSELAKRKKKKNRTPFWYFWKTLKQVMLKICIKNESFDLLGQMRVRIQSPYIDIHNDYGDKLLFMESVLKLCEFCEYWSPVEVMEKALEIHDSTMFNKDEISDIFFLSSFHLEFCKKVVLPWVKILAIFKPQAFEDVINNSSNVIEYWTKKKETAQNSAEETERETNSNNDNNNIIPEDQIKKEQQYENNGLQNDTSDDNEYNYYDND